MNVSMAGRGESDMNTVDHSRMVAPTVTELTKDAIKADDLWCQTLAVVSFPKHVQPGILDALHTHPSSQVDVAIHTDPEDREVSIANFDGAIRDLKGTLIDKKDRNSATVQETKRRLEEHEEAKQMLVEGETQVLNVSVYVTVRSETREKLRSTVQRIVSEMTGTQVTFKPVSLRQQDGLVATSPMAKDPLEVSTKMLAGAAAALFPFSSSTVIEESGILLGYHAVTDAPVMVDRFDRENGYNAIISGKTGDGKSFGSKLMLLRRMAKDPDTLVFVIDPLSDYRRLVEKLNGEHVVIGGASGLNPLDIQPTPQHVLDRTPGLNPFGKKMSSVMGFFSDYLESQGIELGFKRTVLDMAVSEAYDRAGITERVETHSRDSPTVRDVRGILREIAEEPRQFSDVTDRGADEYEDAATKLRMALHPFSEGQSYAHLGGGSDIDIGESNLVYLDMQQSETEREIGLMMQLLLDAIYQRIKTTSKKAIVCIDEAHYLLENENSLSWLDRVTRHARHHDMSVHLSTQKIEDFLSSEKRRTILGNCSIQLHWRENKLTPEQMDALGVTPREGQFIKDALPGSLERGYSQALAVIEGAGTYPIKVKALRDEATLIDEDVARTLGVV